MFANLFAKQLIGELSYHAIYNFYELLVSKLIWYTKSIKQHVFMYLSSFVLCLPDNSYLVTQRFFSTSTSFLDILKFLRPDL